MGYGPWASRRRRATADATNFHRQSVPTSIDSPHQLPPTVRACYSRGMTAPSLPEVWLRGALEGYAPIVMPAAHALLQVREDLTRLADTVPPEHVWMRPGGAASIGFHIRHTGGALDRLLTYARGETLSDAQRHDLQTEEDPGRPPVPLAALVGQATAAVDRGLIQLRATDISRRVRRAAGGARGVAVHRAGSHRPRGGAFDAAHGTGADHGAHPRR